jgi:hypothetical protein
MSSPNSSSEGSRSTYPNTAPQVPDVHRSDPCADLLPCVAYQPARRRHALLI